MLKFLEQVKMARESAKNMHRIISKAMRRHPKIDHVLYMPHPPRLYFEEKIDF